MKNQYGHDPELRRAVIEKMARLYVTQSPELRVAKRRRDGSVISYRWGYLHVRAEHVVKRAGELAADSGQQSAG